MSFLEFFILRGLFDKIFINFVDHGTTGLLTFPNECLYADELNSAINNITSGSFRKVKFTFTFKFIL